MKMKTRIFIILQSQEKVSSVSFDENLEAEKIKIIGLYDPEDYDLDINMWSTQMEIN